MDVYVVTVETGMYSEYQCRVDSIFADEAAAVEHVVRDYNGELSDTYSNGSLAWETDEDWAQERWGGCYDVDGRTFVKRAADAPEWWDNIFMRPIVSRIRRMRVIGTRD